MCVGCLGRNPDDFDDYEDGGGDGYIEDMMIDMYGAKVVYRPNTYDYNTGSGAGEGETNDYYGKYAWQILNALYNTYGISHNDYLKQYLKQFTQYENENGDVVDGYNIDKLPFLYDSIRYKVDTVGRVNKLKQVDAEGNETTSNISASDQYMIIGANVNSGWKWSFDYNLGENNTLNSMLFNNSDFLYTSGNKMYDVSYDKLDEHELTSEALTSAANTLYVDTQIFKDQYQAVYLGATSADDYENYSDYVKALEYVIYCYALDLKPAEIKVTINNNVSTENPVYYTVQVGTYSATQDKSSVDVALQDIKSLFEQIGSYVGLVDRQIEGIGKWVLENVIGWGYTVLNDNFFTYSSVTEVVTTDANGNTTTTYEFDMSNMSGNSFGRNYADNNGETSVVNLIMDAVCDRVSIGNDGEQDVTIDNRFLASEVKEYAGDTFLIAGDENFPKYEEGQSPTAILPLEYQSVTLMLKEETTFTDVWVALKYDADLDGTSSGTWDPHKYIDIIVELNYFSHAKQKLYTVGSQQKRIYDGPYELFADLPSTIPAEHKDDHGTVMFDEFDKNCKDEELKSLLVDGALKVGAFNTEIGNGILKTDVGTSGYNGTPLVSENPLVLVGTTNVRKYYKVIEPADNEISDSNKTYITGRMNEDMFKGNDGCDYLEITYKVLKNKGDYDTNYKFYTGIAFVFGY